MMLRIQEKDRAFDARNKLKSKGIAVRLGKSRGGYMAVKPAYITGV